MIKTIASLLGKRRTLQAELELDHVELSSDSLILGLQVTWKNTTPEPVEIREAEVSLFHQGKRNGAPLLLSYNGRYVRIPYQKNITKIAGVNSFSIRPGASHIESLRFLTREILDLKDGAYHAELHTTVAEGTYVHDFELKVVPQLKLRVSGAETAANPAMPATSAAYTRALRLGVSSHTPA